MSVVINRLSINNVVFTLQEKVPANFVVGSYLFSLTNKGTQQIKNFIAQDISDYPDSYNEFNIEEVASGSESLLLGKVNLQPAGEWNYTIYAQTSTTNLVPASANHTVEKGLVRVIGGDVAEYNEYVAPADQSNYYTPDT